jgi:hypothetical protein
MGNTLAADTIPVLVTMVDVHNPKSQDQFYFCNVSSGGASTKVIGRSQTLSVEVGITTVLAMTVYECPEPVFTPETARCLGVLRIPIERLAERYSSGIFQQWFNLDVKSDPRMPAGDPQKLVSKFEQAYTDAVVDIYQPKICLSVIGSAFEVQRGARQAFSIFVGEDVKTQAGPDLKALIASHKQQAAYIDALHEELRRLNVPSYRPMASAPMQQLPPAEMQRTVMVPERRVVQRQVPRVVYDEIPEDGSAPPRSLSMQHSVGAVPGAFQQIPQGSQRVLNVSGPPQAGGGGMIMGPPTSGMMIPAGGPVPSSLASMR